MLTSTRTFIYSSRPPEVSLRGFPPDGSPPSWAGCAGRDRDHVSSQKLRETLCTLLGGRCAEETALGCR